MRTTAELKREHATLLADVEAILDAAEAEDRSMTDAETAEYENGIAKLTRLKAEIQAQPDRQRPAARMPLDVDLDGLPSADSRRAALPSHGRLRAFPNTARGREQAHVAGRFLAATFLRDPRSMRWCEEHHVGFDPMAALSGGINTAGGALVPDELARTVIELMEVYGDFRRNADTLTMGSDTLTVPRRTGGLTAYYIGEGQDGTESDASWDDVTFSAKKLMVLTRMSSEISEDAIVDLGDRMALEISLAFAFKEDSVGFTGTGIATDGGQVGVLVKAIDGNHAKAKVTASGAANSCDTLDEITSDHLVQLMAAVPKYAKRGSAWYCSPTAQSVVFDAIKLAGGGNNLETLANAPAPVFLGYPLIVSPVFPDDVTTDLSAKVMIAFGNLRLAATVATRRQIRVAVSDQRYFEKDQIGIKGTLRHSIEVHDLGSASAKSPFVVLVGN